MSELFVDTDTHQKDDVDFATNIDENAHDENISSCASRTRHVENFIVIWLDASISEHDDDTNNSIRHLRRIVNSIQTFTESDRCIEFLKSIKNEKVFMIVSGAFGQEILPLIEHMTQLRSIYLFCMDKLKHEQWSKAYPKIQGVYVEITGICQILERHVQQSDMDLIPISIVTTASSSALNELDQLYMYSQLLKDILLELETDEKLLKEFTEFCRVQYSDNDDELKIIDEFEQKYHSSVAIWWYTRNCFTHAMLNKALRTLDIDIIFKMRFFIRDLHQQLQQLHKDSAAKQSFVVYRGQGMLNDEFNKLKNNIGCLLSFNSFLSTSTDRTISLDFAHIAHESADMTAVLFHMTIDPCLSSTPFASLDEISYYLAEENEILFSTHTIFRIGEIEQLKDRLWEVSLTLTNDKDEQRMHLTEFIRQEIEGPTALHRLGSLMIKMGEWKYAEDIYRNLLDSTSSDERLVLASLHHQLGYIKTKRGNERNAMHHYNRSIEIEKSHSSSDNPRLSATYSNMGNVFLERGDLDKGLENFERALSIECNASQPDVIKIATLYDNIGGVFKKQGKYVDALESYDVALDIKRTHLPPYHSSLAAIYNNIGGVHYSLKDYPQALSYYEKTLEIDKKCLLDNHPSFITTYSNLAKVLSKLSRYKETVEYMKYACNVARHTYSSDSSEMKTLEKYLDRFQRKSEFTIDTTRF